MTNKYDELISAFEQKLRLLMSGYESLREENLRLKEELNRRQDDIMAAHKQILDIRENYDNLRLARGIASTPEEREESKKRIASMVREIDKCIALLND